MKALDVRVDLELKPITSEEILSAVFLDDSLMKNSVL